MAAYFKLRIADLGRAIKHDRLNPVDLQVPSHVSKRWRPDSIPQLSLPTISQSRGPIIGGIMMQSDVTGDVVHPQSRHCLLRAGETLSRLLVHASFNRRVNLSVLPFVSCRTFPVKSKRVRAFFASRAVSPAPNIIIHSLHCSRLEISNTALYPKSGYYNF